MQAQAQALTALSLTTTAVKGGPSSLGARALALHGASRSLHGAAACRADHWPVDKTPSIRDQYWREFYRQNERFHLKS